MVYLDNGATTYPKPPSVVEAVSHAMRSLSFNPGRGAYDAAAQTAEMIFDTRKRVGAFFACPPDGVVFTANCTTALNFCIKGLVRRGDHVICSSLEHNAVMRPLATLHRQGGVSVEVAEVIFGDPAATVRSFERLIRPNTRMIICTHASNVLGTVLPIGELGRICSEKGILFVVDAAQTAGILPIDMEQMHIDYLCVAAHKGLYAPMACGLLLCRGDSPIPLIEGGTGSNSIELTQPQELPERLESGTLAVPLIAGASAGIAFVQKKGIEQIYKHELSLIGRAYRGLSALSAVNLYAPAPVQGMSAPVLSFNVAGMDSGEVGALLAKNGIAVRAGLHCAPTAHKHIGTLSTGTVRIVPSVFTKESDIDRFLLVVKNLSRTQKSARNY